MEISGSGQMWQYVAIGGIVWLGLSLLQSGARCFKPQLIDLDGQILALIMGAAGMAAYIVVLGLEVKGSSLLAGAGLGVMAGFAVALLAGYEDVHGFAVIRGSGWFLILWALSGAAALLGVVRESDEVLAASLVLGAGSLGAGLGQLIFSWNVVLRVETGAAFFADLVAEEGAIPEAYGQAPAYDPISPVMYSAGTAVTSRSSALVAPTCPNGHPQTGSGRFCLDCGVPTRCPDGHLNAAADNVFCAECGQRLRPTPI